MDEKNKIDIREVYDLRDFHIPDYDEDNEVDLRFGDNESHIVKIGDHWYYIHISEWGSIAKISEEEAKKAMSDTSFKCVICGEKAVIWHEYNYKVGNHLNGDPEDGHFPVPPEQSDNKEVD